MSNNHHFVGGTLYWDSMDDFYADTEDFIERRGYDVGHLDNRERLAHAASMAAIDARCEPLPPEKPDMLRLIRMYIKGMGGLRYAKSVGEARYDRLCAADPTFSARRDAIASEIIDEVLAVPDYYTDAHAASCRCELCCERGVVCEGDEQMAQTEMQDWITESYLLHEDQYDMPSWAERYDR